MIFINETYTFLKTQDKMSIFVIIGKSEMKKI
jgi:hypothetical protein